MTTKVSGQMVNEGLAGASGTGGLTKPTFTTLGSVASATTVIGAMNAVVSYIDSGVRRVESWSYPGGQYTPTFGGVSANTATRLALVPDFTTKNTTQQLKIVEATQYDLFSPTDILQMCWYAPITRNSGTGLIDPSVPANVANYNVSPSISNVERRDLIENGSKKISGYLVTMEQSPFGGAVGTYFNVDPGSALTLGRNTSNDLFDSNFIYDDPVVQGASSSQSFAITGRGTLGAEGQTLLRASGASARLNLVSYEPTAANVSGDLVAIPATKWCAYKLYYFAGSKLMVCSPCNAVGDTAAAAIALTHPYDVSPVKNYDRWKPAIHVGYLAIKQGFNPNALLSANAGLYQFYDVNKIAYNGGPLVLLLNAITSATQFAVSMRRVNGSYNGNCLLVRRGSDNAQKDIGFLPTPDANGNYWVDQADIAAFCYGTTGNVVTIYDQSLNARDVTNATTTQQPLIYSGGAIQNINGSPAPLYSGAQFLTATSWGTISQPISRNFVFKNNSSVNNARIVDNALTPTMSNFFSSVTAISMSAGTVVLAATSIGATEAMVSTAVFNGASSTHYKNGTLIGTANAGANAMIGVRIGAAFDSIRFINGSIPEVIVTNTTLGSDRSIIEQSQGAAWGITVV